MLKDRVRGLIDDLWKGSVYAAAKDIGLPIQTLYRIVNGESKNPRATAIHAIAEGCGVTSEWLLTGMGQGPNALGGVDSFNFAASIRWNRVLKQLSLGEDLRDSIHMLPFHSPLIAMEALDPVGGTRPEHQLAYFIEACTAAWATYLQQAIDHYGAKAVADALEPYTARAALGFSYVGDHLLRNPALGDPIRAAIPGVLDKRREGAAAMQEGEKRRASKGANASRTKKK